MNEVDLDWALIGKDPGQRDDYGLLRASATGRLRPVSMAKMVSHFSPGSPSGEHRERPDALPWVTFTFATVSAVRYVGVAIREWPQDSTASVDATGRPIVPTRFFCLPLDDFNRYFGSYLFLYQAVRDLPIPGRNGEFLSVQPRTGRTPTAQERLLADQKLFTAAAAVAAALLDGPVALTPNYPPSKYLLEDRITFLDTVAALLPAGIRATLSAGTWVDNRTSHRIRLAFTQRLRDGAGEIDPDNLLEAGGTAGGHGRMYAENLNRLCRRWELVTVLQWLAADREPYSFNQPDDIVAALAVAERRRLVDRIREKDLAADPGKDVTDDIRGHLGSVKSFDYLAAELLNAFLPEVGSSGDVNLITNDVRLIKDHWVPAALPALRTRCRQLAAADAGNRLLMALLGMTERLGCLPDVLADFLTPWGDAHEVELKVRSLAIDFALDHRGDTDSWRVVRDLLAADRICTIGAVDKQINRDWQPTGERSGYGLSGLLAWLAAANHPASRGILHIFRAVEAPGSFHDTVNADDIARLSGADGIDDQAVQTLLNLVVRLGRLDEVLPVFDGWFRTAVPRFNPQRRADWAAFLGQLDLDSGWRRRLGAALGEPRRRWGRRRGGAGQAAVDSPPEGGPVELAVRWMAADSPGRQDDHGVAWLASHYRPGGALPGGSVLPGEEVSFFGDAAKNVAVVFYSGEESFWCCCHTAYERFAETRPGIAGLYYAACKEMRASGAARASLRMSVPPTAIVADTVDMFGFGVVAATAALLLDGPVTVITGGPSVPLWSRLAFLDAVLALLPAGTYSSLTACTWAPGDRAERFRIAFGDGTIVQDRHVVEWRRLPEVPPLPSGFAREYYRRLLLLRTLFHDTGDIVRALAADNAPLDLEIPDHRFLAATITDGVLFESVRESGAVPEKCSKWVTDVLAGCSGKDDGDVGTDVRTLEALLADGSLPEVEDARRYALRLRDRGRLDRVLGALLAQTPKGAVRLRRVRAGTVALVRELCVNEWLPNNERRWPEVDRGLLRTPLISLEVAVQEMRAGSLEGLRCWLDRMDGVGGLPWILAPFRTLLDRKQIAADIPDPTDLVAYGADGLRALLQLARCLDREDGARRLSALLGRLPGGWGQIAESVQWFSGLDVSAGGPTGAGTNGVLTAGGSGRAWEACENAAHGSDALLQREQQ